MRKGRVGISREITRSLGVAGSREAALRLARRLDPLDLVEDARRAAVGLRARGIDGFGVVLGSNAMNSAVRIFGRGNTMLVPRVEDLPSRLSELYFRLARR